ncbi:MAG TPA: alpha/beta fold hydrolase [Polyangia bacterium]
MPCLLAGGCATGKARPAASASAAVPPLAGTWQGVLDVDATTHLRAILHLVHAASGWTATFDSPDQSGFGIPARNVLVDAARVHAEVPDVPFTYDASVDGNRLLGTLSWKGRPFALNLARRAASAQAAAATPTPVPPIVPPTVPPSAEGIWSGALDINGIRLRLVLKIRHVATGWAATLDSIDQNVRDIPVDTVTAAGDELKLTLGRINGTYKGRVAGDKMSGTWTQNGQSWPLDLSRTDHPPGTVARPQEPKRPLPYRELELLVENRAAGATLACTLTEPPGAGPFGAVVMATGSGPQDRDEALMGHRPFLVLADALTRAGVAVLRCDDRGVAKSTGTYGTATTMDFVDDTLAEVAALRMRPEIAPAHVGIVGHSEGGEIAAIAAAKSKEVAFIVMLAGPAVPGDQTLDLQRGWAEKAAGATDQAVAESKKYWDQAFVILKSDKETGVAERELRAIYDGLPAGDRAQLEQAGGFGPLARKLLSPWMRGFIALDPRPYLARLKVPVLALNGELDRQVLPRENLPEMKKALRHDADVTVRELPGLNHLFQTAKTGAVTEYAQLDETMSPAVLKLVSDWVARHAK